MEDDLCVDLHLKRTVLVLLLLPSRHRLREAVRKLIVTHTEYLRRYPISLVLRFQDPEPLLPRLVVQMSRHPTGELDREAAVLQCAVDATPVVAGTRRVILLKAIFLENSEVRPVCATRDLEALLALNVSRRHQVLLDEADLLRRLRNAYFPRIVRCVSAIHHFLELSTHFRQIGNRSRDGGILGLPQLALPFNQRVVEQVSLDFERLFDLIANLVESASFEVRRLPNHLQLVCEVIIEVAQLTGARVRWRHVVTGNLFEEGSRLIHLRGLVADVEHVRVKQSHVLERDLLVVLDDLHAANGLLFISVRSCIAAETAIAARRDIGHSNVLLRPIVERHKVTDTLQDEKDELDIHRRIQERVVAFLLISHAGWLIADLDAFLA